MGILFMVGALGISIVRTNVSQSRIKDFQARPSNQQQGAGERK